MADAIRKSAQEPREEFISITGQFRGDEDNRLIVYLVDLAKYVADLEDRIARLEGGDK